MTKMAWGPVAGIPIKWSYADAAAREAESGATADHVGSLAWQLDNNSFWILSDNSPLTWVSLGGDALALLTTPGDMLYMPFTESQSADKPVTSSGTGTGDPNDLTGGDSDPFTTDAPGDGEWVKIDMEAPVELGYIRVIQETDGDHQANEYLLEYSLNDTDWATASIRGSLPGDEDMVAFSTGPKTGRYWRLTCTDGATMGWTIFEIALGDVPVASRLPLTGGRYLKSGPFTFGWDTMDIRDAINVNDEDYTDGDIFVYSSSQWRKVGVGSEGDVLTIVSGVPAWQAP